MYVYRKTEPQLWTVGYYTPSGAWEPESDHDNRDDAAARCHYLNGGAAAAVPTDHELWAPVRGESAPRSPRRGQ